MKNSKRVSQIMAGSFICVAISACGGGGNDNPIQPVSVGIVISSLVVSPTVKTSQLSADQKKAFSDAGIQVFSAKCFRDDNKPPSDGLLRPPIINADRLFVYQIQPQDLLAASKLGFTTNYPTTFLNLEIPCDSGVLQF